MNNEKIELIIGYAQQGAQVRQTFFLENAPQILRIAELMAKTIANGQKILLCGNGGSAADAQHLAAEFVNRFEIERNPLPAVSLTTDTSILTAIGNDYGFDQTFSKQIQAVGKNGDLLLAISTSGKSPNIIKAIQVARSLGVNTVGLTGAGGGAMVGLCDHLLIVPSKRTAFIQEVHISCGHLLCLLVDLLLTTPKQDKIS